MTIDMQRKTAYGSVGLLAGMVLFCSTSIVVVYVATTWRAIQYSLFELPKVESAISTMPWVKFQRAYNLHPDDEDPFYLIELEIEGKGRLVVANLTVDAITQESAIRVYGVDSCGLFLGLPQSDIPTMTLVDAVAGYDAIKSHADILGLCQQ